MGKRRFGQFAYLKREERGKNVEKDLFDRGVGHSGC